MSDKFRNWDVSSGDYQRDRDNTNKARNEYLKREKKRTIVKTIIAIAVLGIISYLLITLFQ
ncbi:MAG: hypothetical protein LWX56_00385 [Ignavibacteria bacterium]|nr:hypothetical protein [Ignavibacteria bacterium]